MIRQTRRLVTLSLAIAGAAPLAAQDAPSVTLFSSGRTLVRRTLPLRIPSGEFTQQVTVGMFDPSTFAVLDPGVTVNRIAFDGGTSEESLLRRNIGRSFGLQQSDPTKPDQVATLVAVDPERWDIHPNGAGGIVFGRPGRIVWERERIPLEPVADITFTSDRARDNVKVMYETQGGAWGASYRLFLGRAGRIEGVATIGAGILNLANAQVQLLAGEIGSRPPPVPMRGRNMYVDGIPMAARESAAMAQEAVGEARLYTLPGTLTFVPGTQLSAPLFAPATAPATRLLRVHGSIPFWGGFGQEPEEQEVPVEVTYRIDHKIGTAFGDLPLPAGGFSVYDTDRAGRVQLIGMGGIGHTAPGEQLDVATGNAFDVTARRTQTEFTTTLTPRTPNTTVRTIAQVGYKVVIANAKDSAVVVEVREDRGGEWSVTSSSVAADRRSSSRVVFPVTVPAKGEVTLTYRLRVVW